VLIGVVPCSPHTQLFEQHEPRVVLIDCTEFVVSLRRLDGNSQQWQHPTEFAGSNPPFCSAVYGFEHLGSIVEEHRVLQQPLEGPSVDQLIPSRVRRTERQRDNLAMIKLWPQLVNRALHLGL
jgi:hypothetical protein